MKIYEAYKNLLVEAQIESCVKSFGHELFGNELGGKEPNTGLENTYVRYIEDFTDNKYGEETDPSFVKALKTLKTCMGQYPEVLVPESTKIYRGIVLPVKDFIAKKQPISLTQPIPYLYKAPNKIQSWSNDLDAASTFGNHDTVNEVAKNINFADYATPEARQQLLKEMIAEDLRIAFVLEYHANPQEFIFKSKYFRILSSAHHEDELIRIDNKPIQVNAMFNQHEDVFLSMKGLTLIKYINAGIQGR
jgi:hypothetical protein